MPQRAITPYWYCGSFVLNVRRGYPTPGRRPSYSVDTALMRHARPAGPSESPGVTVTREHGASPRYVRYRIWRGKNQIGLHLVDAAEDNEPKTRLAFEVLYGGAPPSLMLLPRSPDAVGSTDAPPLGSAAPAPPSPPQTPRVRRGR